MPLLVYQIFALIMSALLMLTGMGEGKPAFRGVNYGLAFGLMALLLYSIVR